MRRTLYATALLSVVPILLLVACTGVAPSAELVPIAVLNFDPVSTPPVAPATVSLDGSGSSDPDGHITNYTWRVEDKSFSGPESSVDYTFERPGIYEVRLRVTDDDGHADEVVGELTVSAPAVQITNGDLELPMNDLHDYEITVRAEEPWELTSSDPWLGHSESAGSPGVSVVRLRLERGNLPTGPDAVAILTVTGAETGSTHSIKATVLLPEMAGLTPRTLELRAAGNSTVKADIVLTNSGRSPLEVTLESAADWLTVSPGTTSIGEGEEKQFTVEGRCDTQEETLRSHVTVSSNDPRSPAERVDVSLDCSVTTASSFSIDVIYYGATAPSAQERLAFDRAAERWSQLIVGDLSDRTGIAIPANQCGQGEPAFNGHIDDLVIYVSLGYIDGVGGVLGSAGPCAYRGSDENYLPLKGVMRFDSADIETLGDRGILEATILHEMGHVLGIGTLWEVAHDFIDPSGTACVPDQLAVYRFNGANANAAHQNAGGDGGVFVEGDGGRGTACGHWDEAAYANELMTGWIAASGGNPLSAITVGSLADLGYEVDYRQADPYSVPAPGSLRLQAADVQLRESLFAAPISPHSTEP